MSDINDGSDKPLGYVSDDGQLEVRESVDRDGRTFRGYHETELGQHDRWLRQAPDLFEKYTELQAKYHDLLFCVSKHYEGETRHETARKMLLQHDSECGHGGPASEKNR